MVNSSGQLRVWKWNRAIHSDRRKQRSFQRDSHWDKLGTWYQLCWRSLMATNYGRRGVRLRVQQPGREAHEGGDICIPMTDSYWCMAETITILSSNYPPVKNKIKNFLEDSTLSMQGARFRFLIRELRSHILCGAAKRKGGGYQSRTLDSLPAMMNYVLFSPQITIHPLICSHILFP